MSQARGSVRARISVDDDSNRGAGYASSDGVCEKVLPLRLSSLNP